MTAREMALEVLARAQRKEDVPQRVIEAAAYECREAAARYRAAARYPAVVRLAKRAEREAILAAAVEHEGYEVALRALL